jgi:hypothetical protein
MQMQARTWLRFCLYSQFVIIPLLIVGSLGVFGVIHTGWSIAGFVVLIGFGLSGAVLRLLNMMGRVELVFTKQDMDSWILRWWYDIETGFLANIAESTVILEGEDSNERR